MAASPTKQKTPKVFRSMSEFKKHYLPNAYEKEQEERENEDPEQLGESMARDFLEGIRRELEKQT